MVFILISEIASLVFRILMASHKGLFLCPCYNDYLCENHLYESDTDFKRTDK